MEFDFVVIGAGSSGAVVANRLSSDPRVSVALIEAGGPGRGPLIDIPGVFGVHALLRTYNWGFTSEPCPGTAGRIHYCPRGKAVGGSSAINGMVYVRGAASDFDHWAALGNRGWSYADLLPYFRRSEANSRGEDDYHGGSGELAVSDVANGYPPADAFVDAAIEAGYPSNPDFNASTIDGVGHYQFTIGGGRRSSARRAFIDPIAGRPNLTLLIRTHALRINFAGRRAASVTVRRQGVESEIRARREVIVCAGTFGTPQLLMLSGVGPAEALAEHGIAPVHHLPGVGRNLVDHPQVGVGYRSRRRDGFSLGPWGMMRLAGDAARYLTSRGGRLAQSLAPAGGFIRSRSDLDAPDLQLHFFPALYGDYGRKLLHLVRRALSCHVALGRPRSAGAVTLRSADPLEAPRIQLNLLDHRDDVEALVRGVGRVRRIMAQPALADFVGQEIGPGPGVESDADVETYVRRNCQHAHHPVGTARMGRDQTAVVDDALRVHGIDALRIADASIMPSIVSGNTNAPCIMIGEKCADLVLGRSPPTQEIAAGSGLREPAAGAAAAPGLVTARAT